MNGNGIDPGTPEMAALPGEARAEVAGDWARLHPYREETYYGLPAVKSSYYGWYVAFYFFIGGLASAAQFLATVISFLGRKEDRPVVRAGRYLALAGALASPPLLIADLHTPQRWYNMLRIYRGTSPMSIGSWALTAFGTLSGLVAAGQAAGDLLGWKIGRWFAQALSLPAALAGGVVSIYTGTLLAATSTPLWAAAYPFISSLFAASAASTATAALTVAASAIPSARTTRRRLTWFALISGIVELALAVLVDRRWRARQVAAPLRSAPLRPAWYVGVLGLGILGPLAVHLLELVSGRESRRLSAWASWMTLLVGLLLRAVLIFGGNRSGRRPKDYFHMAQPDGRRKEASA